MDQWVGSHTFNLQADLPKQTKLELTRDYDEAQEQFTNSYTATLTADGVPQLGCTVRFSYHLRYTDDYDSDGDPRIAGTHVDAITDEHGRANIDLSDKDDYTNMHQSYRVAVKFDPGEQETQLSAAKSDIYSAYFMTMTQTQLNG